MTSVERYGPILVSDTADAVPAREFAPAAADLQQLVQTYSALLFRVAHALLRDPVEAEDAVQDAYLRVLAHQERLSTVEDMRVWLVRIVWRLALDRKRRITPGQMDDLFVQTLVSRSLPADQALEQSHELHRVLREMDRLPTAERDVLLLCGLEEMKTAEIAAVLNRSESAVRALLFRARTRLRERLERQGKRSGR